MYYYEVNLTEANYTSPAPLTYQSPGLLSPGSLVVAPYRNKQVLGFIQANVKKPGFKTKALIDPGVGYQLPGHLTKLFDWLSNYYPAGNGSLGRLFLPVANLKTRNPGPEQPAFKQPDLSKLPALTAEQMAALKTFKHGSPAAVLLHGETSSGKTRVYLERAAQLASQRAKSSLILTPEISLTPQLQSVFAEAFGDSLVVYHSGLTPAQRRDIWWRIALSDKPMVVIGPRSALFCPVKNLGLIVIDEFHEQAYKQENQPHYQTTRVAAQLARLAKADLVLGSATPLIADYYTFAGKHLPIIRMEQPAIKTDHPANKIKIIDLKDHANFGQNSLLANQSIAAIKQALDRSQQSLVFLNRRGTARLVMCNNCGWQALCPHCDIPLTYHGDAHQMRCHGCAFKDTVPLGCPVCQHSDLIYRSPGTKALTQELKNLFPQARVARFDSDSSKTDSFQANFQQVKDGEVDILIGTQLLTKGLDLPKLSVVVITNADASLNFPDFTAAERTYQLLYQVIGRVGRGHQAGYVFVQTYQPNGPVIRAAVKRDWSEFYREQIKERQLYRFPPFSYLLKIIIKRKSSSSSFAAAEKLATSLRQRFPGLDINGPAPAFIEQQGGDYHWQLIVKSSERQRLLDVIGHLPANSIYDIDPNTLL